MKNELKTLKDINICKYFDYCVNPTLKCKEECYSQDIKQDLKQEAIKRIKYYQEKMVLMNPETVIKIEGYNWTFGRISGAISAWTLVFNITEEDLK